MKFYYYNTLMLILILFSGCSQHVPIPKKITNNEKEIKIVVFPRIDKFNVPVNYKSDNIIADSKTYQLILSNYRKINDVVNTYNDSVYIKDFDATTKTNSNSSKKSVIYSFTVGSLFCNNEIKITRNYSIKKTKLAYIISIESPHLIEISDSDAGLCSSSSMIQGIIKKSKTPGFWDQYLLMGGLIDTKGTHNRPLSAIKGELNSSFSKESILGNLDRVLVRDHDNIYKFSVNGTDYLVEIKVYPYKNGSKVVWKSTQSYDVYFYPIDNPEKYLSEEIKKNIEGIKIVNQKIIAAIKD